MAWWAHVTEIPDDNKIIVFNRGTLNALNVKMPRGGHSDPNSTAGASLL